MKQRAILLSPNNVVVVPQEALTNAVVVQAHGACSIRLDASSDMVYGFHLTPNELYCVRTPFSVWSDNPDPKNPSRLILYPVMIGNGEMPFAKL